MRIVEAGSLTAAANTLETSLPTVVRTLASLEQHLGVSLLRRTTRRIHLTDKGAQYLEHCRDILSAMQEAEGVLGAGCAEPVASSRSPLRRCLADVMLPRSCSTSFSAIRRSVRTCCLSIAS